MKEFIEIRKGFSIAKNSIDSFWCNSQGKDLDVKGVGMMRNVFSSDGVADYSTLYSYNELKALLNGEDDYITK